MSFQIHRNNNQFIPKVGGVFIVDLEPVFRTYSSYTGLYPLYNVFPLKEMISLILTSYYDQDVTEIIDIELDRRLGEDNSKEYIDVFLRDIFLSGLIETIEDHLYSISNRKFDYADYSLDKWVGETTAVLVKPV